MGRDWRNGLKTQEVEKIRSVYGENVIAQERKLTAIKIFWLQLKSPLIYVLLLASVVTFWLGDYVDTGVILFAVAINTLLGFFQEYRAEKSLEALKGVLAPRAKVYRDGEWKMVLARELVPGDLVYLADEHKVPADGILVGEEGLFTNEAILTGESAPVEKYDCESGRVLKCESVEEVRSVFDKVDNKHKAFMGTEVKMGVGRMIVIRIGGETAVGKVAKSLKDAPAEQTPLQIKVERLSKQLAVLVGVVSLLVLLAGLAVGDSFEEIFPTAVALAVASIPEGLVVSLTVILAIGMQRILKQKAVVRRLTAAETLGSVNVICADKTGTLTEGKMRVTGAVLDIDGKPSKKKEKDMVMTAVLCNDMRDPLEYGMSDWARSKVGKLGEGVKSGEELKKKYERVYSLPFNSRDKYIATLHKDGVKQKLLVSGAPEVVLSMAKGMSKREADAWKSKFEEMGSKGYRLVGFGQKTVSGKLKIKREDIGDIDWIGILVYEDPVRKGVRSVLNKVKRAGIGVKVITGDYRETAVAILKQLELLGDEVDGLVMEGDELEEISDTRLDEVIDRVILFARTNPEQKLRIVEALKRRGNVVAMTGDGVNDAPALKRADIGIVVNEASEVSKETADVVLLDSNFKTIVMAIEEGRGVYDNLKKIIVYLLADAFAEIVVVVGGMLLGWPLPILATQILWINLISDGFPSMALTVEPREGDVLKDPPRGRSGSLIDGEVVTLIVMISSVAAAMTLMAFGYVYNILEYSLEHARTVAFVMLGVNSLFYVFSSRSLSEPIWRVGWKRNPWLLLGVGMGFVLQVIVVYVPFLQEIFQTVELDILDWLIVVMASMVLVAMVEGVKFAYSRSS
ncbi:cation-translocating P-type ATPase [Candidatus Chazhemtobacterium aquaticus]|uniref:P-type cation-transporting ATPase n=1 Tax=Candidatus Chazhemtobacterium aquaticus TaxID=2715735 RepID=A0A857NFF2_9BACT|nr:HAD-IC family P-type ATPase [Candidatus Chazhemtobacterium aquaticus]QHO63038.1 P-type cation-transporting ATPase [Candidatus Chazhemtobacterium aquaticus]